MIGRLVSILADARNRIVLRTDNEWSARRQGVHHLLFNVGALSLASLAAAGTFALALKVPLGGPLYALVLTLTGVVAGAVYFALNTGLVTIALSLRATSDAVLGEILDAWFAGEPSPDEDDRANVAHVDEIR
jgi:hypothetical protein